MLDSLFSWIPPTYRIAGGLYADYDLPLLPEALFDPARSGTPLPLRLPLSAWQNLPVSVCVVQSAQGGGIDTGTLTETIAGAITDFNAAVGTELLAGVRACQDAGAGRTVRRNGITIRAGTFKRNPDDVSFAHTTLAKTCVLTRGYPEGCLVAKIDSAAIWLRLEDAETLTAYRAGGVIRHELLHAFGMEHTCVVPTLLVEHFDQRELAQCRALASKAKYPPARQTHAPSPYDVAHLLLLRELAGKAMEKFSGLP